MTWQLAGRPLNAILVSRLRYLGDVVMATPLLEVLRRGDPDLRLGFLAEQGPGQVLEGHPDLDHRHLLITRRRGADFRARAPEPAVAEALSGKRMLWHLRKFKYDLAVDLFFNPRSAWLLRLSGIPLRIGGTRGSRRKLFTHNVLPAEDPATFAPLFKMAPGGLGEHLGRLAPLVHGPSGLGFLDWMDQEFSGTALKPRLPSEFWGARVPAEVLPEVGSQQPGPVVLAPGATWPSKEWPLDHWQELIRMLLDQTSGTLLVLQPPGQANPWSALGALIPPDRGRLLPPLPLPSVLGLLSRARLLISVDGGIMHAGVGFSVPTLALFGPTDPGLWFPYSAAGPFKVLRQDVECSPCDRHHCDEFICLPRLSPGRVMAQSLEFLKETGGD